jgi:hypothetical protein
MASQTTVMRALRALKRMTTGELRTKYREVFGEDTASRNKDYLFRRLAAALRERAAPPPAAPAAAAAPAPSDVPPRRRRTVAAAGARDPRLPPPGTVLRREFDGRTYAVTVLADGFEFEGARWRSLSAIARKIAGGTSWNGLLFFRLIPYAKRAKAAA